MEMNMTTYQHNDMIIKMTRNYEDIMNKYIYSIPYIPPTLFELQHRHTQVRDTLLAECRTSLARSQETTEVIDTTCEKLRRNIDIIYKTLVVNDINEHKLCQTGFVLGWKKDIEPRNKKISNPELEDRFWMICLFVCFVRTVTNIIVHLIAIFISKVLYVDCVFIILSI